jgi:hypothetical protein
MILKDVPLPVPYVRNVGCCTGFERKLVPQTVQGMDPRIQIHIRIRTKISQIRNTDRKRPCTIPEATYRVPVIVVISIRYTLLLYSLLIFSDGEPDKLRLLGQGGDLNEQRAEPDARRLVPPAHPCEGRMCRVSPAAAQSTERPGHPTLCRECR